MRTQFGTVPVRYSVRILIVRETNERAVKIKRGLIWAVVSTKESHAPSAAYWYATSARGVQNNVRVKTINEPCGAYEWKQIKVQRCTKSVRGDSLKTN